MDGRPTVARQATRCAKRLRPICFFPTFSLNPLLRYPSFQERPTPLQGFAYDELKDVIKKFEVHGMRGSSPFCSSHTIMQLVDRGGRGEECAWVRKCNSDTFASM